MMDGQSLEDSLKILMTHQPDPAFVESLEQRLLAEQSVVKSGLQKAVRTEHSHSLLQHWRDLWAKMIHAIPRVRWVAASLTVLVLLLVSLLAVGPERAWAGLQDWLGYVPGVGFVDLEENRLLTNPVNVTRGGVTLRVSQAVASPEETVVVIDSEGLPPQRELWPDGRELPTTFQAWLRLPGGETLTPTSRTIRFGAVSLTFPPLPADVFSVVLELPRLPLLPAGIAPENWAVPLSLEPVTSETVAGTELHLYRPQAAVDSHQGVMLRVLEVAHHPEETAVHMQLDWENPEWENHFGPRGLQLPYLRDAEGNRYDQIPGSTTGSQVVREVQPAAPGDPTPPPNRWVGSETFEAVPPATEALTLVVDGVDFDIPASGSFTIDLGDSPQVGDTWDLNVTLDVAGFPVHITGAELVEEEIYLHEKTLRQTVLRFEVEPVPEQGNKRLLGLFLDVPGSAFDDTTGYTPATNKIRVSLALDEGMPVPGGKIHVNLRGASLMLRGPWEVVWPVPGAGNGGEGSPLP
jgi:hypothetical protein